MGGTKPAFYSRDANNPPAHSTRVIYSLRLPNTTAPARRPFFCYFSLDEQRKGNVTLHPIIAPNVSTTEVNDRDYNNYQVDFEHFR